MSDVIMYGLIGGGAAALAVFVVSLRAQKATPDIVKTLSERGPSTIGEIMETLGMKGYAKMGYVQNALVELMRQGKVTSIEPPADTPRLQRAKLTKYEAIGARAPVAQA